MTQDVVHGQKTPIDVVQKYAAAKGGELLSTVYKNALSKLTWRCAEGHVFETTFNHVKNRGQWCPICGQKAGLKAMRESFATNPEIKKRISCGHQGIPLDQFDGFVTDKNRKKRKLRRHNERYKTDIHYRLKVNLRNRLRHAVKNNQKIGSAVKDLGCTVDKLKSYLESQFTPGMAWSNYGRKGWHIDHIKPLSKFDLTNLEQFKQACHYSNLQPLWAEDNMSKGDKYEEHNDIKQMDD